MVKRNFLDHHIVGVVRGSLAEADGDENLSRRLRAETKLRLVSMSDDELWALAEITACPPIRPVEQVYEQIKQAIEHYKTNSRSWVADLVKRPLPEDE